MKPKSKSPGIERLNLKSDVQILLSTSAFKLNLRRYTMVANISCGGDQYNHTINTLKYADRAKVGRCRLHR
jgi:hypothetical protein